MVVGDETDEIERADLAALDEPPGLTVGRVEPALETDLDGRTDPLDMVDQLTCLRQVERERFLAEDRLRPIDGGADERRVGIRRGGDHDRVGRVHRLLDAGRRPTPRLARCLNSSTGVDVGEKQLVYLRPAGEQLRVEQTDPADSDDGDLHPSALHSAGSARSTATVWRIA